MIQIDINKSSRKVDDKAPSSRNPFLEVSIHKLYVFRNQDFRIFECTEFFPFPRHAVLLYISYDEYVFILFRFGFRSVCKLCDAKISMQFNSTTKEVEKRANYCELAAVSPNRNPSENNREQNVSFDRSTPGLGWRF